MIVIGWLARSGADVPAGDAWLSARERAALADLSSPRASDWRLGRWTAKAALRALDGWGSSELEILSAEDGAPEVLAGGRPAPVSLSLSHRSGRALAVVADAGTAVGCDLEPTEPRSGAFVRTWFAPSERAAVESADEGRRAALVNLIWTAKEAATKLRREGLRLDPRRAVVELDWEPAADGEWRRLEVRWDREALTASGWWRQEPGWVLSCVSEPPTSAPVSLL